MDTYLTSIGWWNFIGSLLMLGMFNENFAKNMLYGWTKLFTIEIKIDFWFRFWMGWAIGLNIFYGAINILCVRWNVTEMKQVVIGFDVFAYGMFLFLLFRGFRSGIMGKEGFYSTLCIFSTWFIWGICSLL